MVVFFIVLWLFSAKIGRFILFSRNNTIFLEYLSKKNIQTFELKKKVVSLHRIWQLVNGVMVTLQILVLSFKVRVLVAQQKNDGRFKQPSFFCCCCCAHPYKPKTREKLYWISLVFLVCGKGGIFLFVFLTSLKISILCNSGCWTLWPLHLFRWFVRNLSGGNLTFYIF